MEESGSEVPDMRQEAKTTTLPGFYEVRIERNDSTTSYNKNFALTLVSKSETVKELLEIGKSFIRNAED